MAEPETLHKYLYAHADPANLIDPSGNMSIGSAMSVVNMAANLASFALTTYDVFQMSTGDGEISAKEFGINVLLSMSSKVGGKAIIGLINKKGCRKGGCKPPPILDEKHIFEGEIKRPGGKASGFHSTAIPSTSIVLSRGRLLRNGVYEARVGVLNPVSGNYKKKNSTMFPDYWSKAMVSASLYAAWNKNNRRDRGKKIINGVRIQYYIHNGIWLRGHPAW